MMMNHPMKNLSKVKIGTVIIGKWHRNQYTILRELGYGANGIVYLAEHGNIRVALKMSVNGMSITSEVNVLKSFAEVQGSPLGPSLIDVDDWRTNAGLVSFYVMEYIHGKDLLSFIKYRGQSWTMVLILQLLNELEKIHAQGWVFGDLKPENLIVTGPPPKIRCIDVGGTTIQGRAVKEFTEFYDRGYWGLGTRRAEPTYDLFAVGMVMLNTAYPNRFHKSRGGIPELQAAIRQKQELLPYERVIMKALQGGYVSAKQMRTELLLLLTHDREFSSASGKSSANNRTVKPQPKTNPPSRKSYRKKKKRRGFLETLLIMMVLIFIYALYLIEN